VSRTGPNAEAGRLVAELLEGWNAHDIARVEALHALEYVGTDVGMAVPCRGPEGVQHMAGHLRAFPDLRLVAEETIVQDGRAVLVWTARGTHLGEIMRIPPTEREIVVRGVSLFTVKDMKIARGLHVWDVAGLLRNIGLLPEL
jgi:steroid delta-isomerase-like uncharacterized protein